MANRLVVVVEYPGYAWLDIPGLALPWVWLALPLACRGAIISDENGLVHGQRTGCENKRIDLIAADMNAVRPSRTAADISGIRLALPLALPYLVLVLVTN